MIAKSPSKRIRTSSAPSPLVVTGCAVSLRNSALSSSEPSGVEHMKSSAKISSKRFTYVASPPFMSLGGNHFADVHPLAIAHRLLEFAVGGELDHGRLLFG